MNYETLDDFSCVRIGRSILGASRATQSLRWQETPRESFTSTVLNMCDGYEDAAYPFEKRRKPTKSGVRCARTP